MRWTRSCLETPSDDASGGRGGAEQQPGTCPAYQLDCTWSENLEAGPQYRPPRVARTMPPEDKWIDFLGHKLASPLGVAAGPLLSSEWVALAAGLGYDCLTYKTIRSHSHSGHGLPNVLYVDAPQQLKVAGPGPHSPLRVRSGPPPPAGNLAITNSFGMPSQGPEQLRRDIPAAAAALGPGQQLVVSITGTPNRPGVTLTQDLVAAAHLALGAGGAQVLEVNLSCPNVGAGQGSLYQDAATVEVLVRTLAEEVGSTPMLLKVGAYADQDQMRRVLTSAASAGAAGISGINGVCRQVEAADGGPALGPCRPTSGICGDPIRSAGLAFTAAARQVVASEGLGLVLVGVGGVTAAHHAMDYLAAGADVVQAATGFMWRPGQLGLDFQRLWAGAGFQMPVADGRGGRA